MLAPSKRFYGDTPRTPKTLLDWARQAALQIRRWLPGRRIVIVGDTAFAAIEFLAAEDIPACQLSTPCQLYPPLNSAKPFRPTYSPTAFLILFLRFGRVQRGA